MAGRLALSMLGIQVAIGALNDRVDWRHDATEKPGKPIPAGLASPLEARLLMAVAAAVGLALSAPSGLPTLATAALGLGLGVVYDLRLSRGPWSWLPLALALPLLPIHAWLGATGSVPPGLLTLAPTGVLAGAALSLANGMVDAERDGRAGRTTSVVLLGTGRAWLAHLALLVAVGLLAVFAAPAVPAGGATGPLPFDVLRLLRTVGVAIGLVGVALGAVVLRAARPAVRERGWELEALGVASVGVGWLAGTAGSSGGG